MHNLLLADFYRIRKDVIFTVALILLIIFSLMMPAILALLKPLMAASLEELGEYGAGISISGKYIFATSMSLTNNFGLILPVLIGIIVCRDFAAGTVRNKIISGHSKSSVYLSHFVSAVLTGVALYALYALLSLVFGSLILGYGSKINSGEIIFILKILLMGTLIFAFTASLSVFFAAVTRSMGMTIILQISAMLLLSVLGSLPAMIADMPGWLETLLKFNPAYQITAAASGSFDGGIFIISILSSIAYIVAITVGGTLIFRSSDQK
jgi:ABC-type transport system involved in multi-copper enzyme maturation permease subunit